VSELSAPGAVLPTGTGFFGGDHTRHHLVAEVCLSDAICPMEENREFLPFCSGQEQCVISAKYPTVNYAPGQLF
jgi:hypothetical protein